MVQYNLVNLLISALGMNLLIAEKNDNQFLFYKLKRNIEVGSAGRKPQIKVCKNTDTAIKILESYRPQENRLFTIVNQKGSYKGQLTESDVLAGIYDCGIYADFEHLLYWKRKKNRKVEDE